MWCSLCKALALFLKKELTISFEILESGCPHLLVLNTFDDVKPGIQCSIDNVHTTSFLSLS
jgi:Fe2+ transport system protein B